MKNLDQPLARETLEGIGRYKQGIYSKEMRAQKRLRFTLAEEEDSGELAGAMVLGLDPTTGKLMPFVAQLQVRNRVSGEFDIFVRKDIGKFELREEIYGRAGSREIRIFAPTKEEHDLFVAELKTAGIDVILSSGTYSEPPFLTKAREGGELSIPVQVEGVVDDIHKRALAKILVNFAAMYLGGEAWKSEWESVRRYVRFGEGLMGARISHKPFWTGHETEELRFPSDSINIRIENLDQDVVGVIQFYNQLTYELLLVKGCRLPPNAPVAYRFTPGKEPIKGYLGQLHR